MTHSNRLISLITFSLWSYSVSWLLNWVVWVFFFSFFEWVWSDCICVFDLNGLSLKEIIRIWFLNGLIWNWGRTGENGNHVTPKKWFAIGDLWIGVICSDWVFVKDENGGRGWRESGLISYEAIFLRYSIIFTFHFLKPKRLRLTNYPSTSGVITHSILFSCPFRCVWIELIIAKNWKHGNKIIFKCVNSIMGSIFNIF